MGRELAIPLQEGEEDPEESEHPGIAREKPALLAGAEPGEGAPADFIVDISGDDVRPDQRQEAGRGKGRTACGRSAPWRAGSSGEAPAADQAEDLGRRLRDIGARA